MKHKIAAFTAFFLLFACLMPIQAKKKCTLRVASFNLRMNTKVDKENAWPLRKETAKDLIRYYSNVRFFVFFLFAFFFRLTRTVITFRLSGTLPEFFLFAVVVGNYGFLDLVTVIGYFKVSHILSFSV